MKINHYAVIPAQVRYDRELTDKSILLFAELTAASNAYGICEEDNQYFASALQMDARSVTRCLQQLAAQGHINKIIEGRSRKIQILTKGFDTPDGVEIEQTVDTPKLDIEPIVHTIFDLWDTGLKMIFGKPMVTEKREAYSNLIRQRLLTFSKEEILSSLKNRIAYMNDSDWHHENEGMARSIEHVLKDDGSVLRWLNTKQTKTTEHELKAFIKSTDVVKNLTE